MTAEHDRDLASEALVHDHFFLGAAHEQNAQRTRWVVALTVVMMISEIIAGRFFGSMALLADGFHMASHALALGIAAGAYAFARRYANNPRFSFGTGKVGDLAGFSSALVLGLIAIGIAVESVERLVNPLAVAYGEAALVAVLGLIVNVVSALLLGGHSHGHGHSQDAHHDHDDEHHHHAGGSDNNLRSAYVHVLADALTSVLAIIALLAGRYFGAVWLDPAIGIVGAIVIATWSVGLIRSSAAVLLDTTDKTLEKEVREHVEGTGDVRITDLHVWQVGPDAHAAIVSVTGAIDAGAIRKRLAPVHELAHVTVECR
ncbi:MAG TPA: CDF family Co(II)/Ni(II) efflux transporter DmeF [Xanthobacteraceae bacterium]|jgi:cation diffusion facilitator family transporter|nr:CDF family Co(II)/Ni(II) efflux transporter DmeF [Xanthobacteraceae bacterium]